MASETVIIGIGKSGCFIVNEFVTSNDKLYFDTDKTIVEKYNGIRIACKSCKEYPAIGSVEGELAVVETKDKIISAIKPYKNIVIVTCLGGGTSNGATKRFVDLALRLKKSVQIFTSLPFDFEGGRRMHDAMLTINYISQLCPTKIVDGKYLIDKPKTLNDIFKEQDQKILKLLEENI